MEELSLKSNEAHLTAFIELLRLKRDLDGRRAANSIIVFILIQMRPIAFLGHFWIFVLLWRK
jgi:hypothetical protein